MVKSRVCSALILFLLCVFIITQSPISNTAQVLAFSKAPMGAGSPCPSPGAADFSNQLIPPSTTTASLPGHVVQPVLQGGAQLVRPLNPNLQLHLAFVFAIRNPTQFQDCLNAISDPSSPQYRRFLNATELQPFLPTPGEKSSVFAFLAHEGLTVTNGPSPLVLDLAGNAQTVMSALGTRLGVYSYRNVTFFAPASDPQIPSNFAPLVNGITGLDNYTRIKATESPCNGPYCPQGIQVGYSIAPLLQASETGSGQKVAVVDAPGDPNSQTAINTFDTQYGLPATNLDIIYPDGTPSSWDSGWAVEATLDIEAVHSVATGASIVLAYGSSPNDDPMNSVDYIVRNGLASVISNSWTYSCGFSSCSDIQLPPSLVSSVDSRLAIDVATGVTVLFASGDEGAKPDGTVLGTEFPSSDPNVLAVGATNLALTGCNTTTCAGYGSESGAAISGGGYSGNFSEPSWQMSAIGSTASKCTTGHVYSTCRGVPDVSMFGYIPYFWVYSTVRGWLEVAGTSLSTPLWAGFLGIALQVTGSKQFGNIGPVVYQLGISSSYSTLFHDVTTGSNGYSAGIGWDPVTGWGSPIANTLASALSPTPQTMITQVDAGSGSVTPPCPGPSGCSENVGFSVTVTATPDSNWFFSHWSTQNGISCSTNPCAFSMPNNAVTLGATFTQVTQTLTTNVASGTGSVSPNCPSGCSEPFGSPISLTATPTSGFTLSSWTVNGASCSGGSTSNPCTFAMPNNAVTVSVAFTSSTVTMTVRYSVAGGGTPTAPVFHYVFGGVSKSLTLKKTAIKVKADGGSPWSVTPNPLTGSTSAERWETNSPSGTASTTSILVVFYHQTLQTLSYQVVGGGTPSAPSFQSSQFGAPTSVTLTNTATETWFDYGAAWTVTNPLGGSSERWFSSQVTSGTIGSASATAFSYQHQYSLTLVANPSTAGTVSSKSGWHNAGSKVAIKATAKTGHTFLSWSGSGTGSYTGTNNPTTITMNSAIVETANFS